MVGVIFSCGCRQRFVFIACWVSKPRPVARGETKYKNKTSNSHVPPACNKHDVGNSFYFSTLKLKAILLKSSSKYSNVPFIEEQSIMTAFFSDNFK